jgi:hypothetical protein
LPQSVKLDIQDALAAIAAVNDGTNESRETSFSLATHILPVILSHLEDCICTPFWDIRTDRSMYTTNPTLLVPPALNSSVFLLHEPDAILDHVPDILFGTGTEKYFRDVLVQKAYMDLVTNVPRLNDNNIQNVLGIVGFVKSVVIDHDLQMPKNLSSAWLQYRYQYGTTKMDYEDAISFVKRRASLPKGKFKIHGTASLAYRGSNIICRAVATVSDRHLALVDKIWKALYTYGLSPTFYVVWDSIPYSFIVDWFIPVGTIAQVWDTQSHYSQYYDVRDLNFSLKYDREIEGRHVSCYTRWLAGTPPELQGRYFFEDDVSSKTVALRSIDLASLVIRR